MGEEASAEKMVGAHAGKVFADEVAAALGFDSLPEESPPRDEQLFGRQKRQVVDALWALREKARGGVVRVEPDFGRDGERKLRTFTIVWRLGTVGDRIEKHVSETLNAALTTANRERGGNQIQCWRAKTRAEKRKRALAKQGENPGGEATSASGGGKAGGKAGGGKREEGRRPCLKAGVGGFGRCSLPLEP